MYNNTRKQHHSLQLRRQTKQQPCYPPHLLTTLLPLYLAAIMNSTTLKSTSPRDFPAAFGELSSTYGLTASTLSPAPTPISLPKFLRRRRATTQPEPTSSAPTAVTSNISFIDSSHPSSDSDRTLTSSTTPQKQKQKDYEHAFGTLASSYGFGSSVIPASTAPSRSLK